MEIPYQQLSKEALTNLITDFVCSTDDYGDYDLNIKIEQITHQLKKGSVVILFDEKSNTCLIQTKEALNRQ